MLGLTSLSISFRSRLVDRRSINSAREGVTLAGARIVRFAVSEDGPADSSVFVRDGHKCLVIANAAPELYDPVLDAGAFIERAVQCALQARARALH